MSSPSAIPAALRCNIPDRDTAGAPNPAAGRWPVAVAAMALMLAGAILPTPLFELYRRLWNLSPAELSLVFAIYAGSLIPSLVFLGGLSDSIGRRRTILLAFALLAVASLVFAFADGLISLVLARIIQGMGIGIGVGAAAAAIREWMSDADRPQAGAATVVAVGVGSTFGALLGGVLGQFAPSPLMLPYFVHIGLLGCAAIAVATVPSCPHLVPTTISATLHIPPAIRRPFLLASVQAFIGWSTFAIFIALVPAFLARVLDLHNLLVGASVITAIQIGSVTGSLTGQRLPSRIAIITAMLALGAGVWLLLIAVALRAEVLVYAAALIAGAGGGLSYLVGLNIIGAISPPDHRAETLSAFLVACYIGFSIPALGVGIAATYFGLNAAFIGAAIVLGAIAVGVIAVTTNRNLTAATA
jgi:predicted MFS family arabinose efflux permease